MKKAIFPILALFSMAISCKKGSSSSDATPAQAKYMSFTAASTWNYQLINNATASTSNYVVTSTNRDSTIGGKSYHVYVNSSSGASEYYNLTGSDYYTFRALGAGLGGSNVETIYLKDNVNTGTSWTQAVSITFAGIPVTVNLTNTVTAKGITKTVNGVTYTDVIHVTTTMAVPGLPPGASISTDIQSFYARKYGMINNINKVTIIVPGFPTQTTDQVTNLTSADIK